jgi:hypothetical protein
MLYKPTEYEDNYFENLWDELALHKALQEIYLTKKSQGHYNDGYLIKFVLPKNKAIELLRELAKMHVSAASLFPGYDGVVKALEEKEKWDVDN